jgi:hypothetical protein
MQKIPIVTQWCTCHFVRCIVSEIVGVNAVEGLKAAIRIDPLGIRATAKVVGGPLDWTVATGAKSSPRGRAGRLPVQRTANPPLRAFHACACARMQHVDCAASRSPRSPYSASGGRALDALGNLAVAGGLRLGNQGGFSNSPPRDPGSIPHYGMSPRPSRKRGVLPSLSAPKT